MLGRMDELEDFLRLALCSLGSDGWRPVDFAKRLRMSESDITPVNLPDTWAPGIAEAGTADGSGAGDWGAAVEPGIMTVGVS